MPKKLTHQEYENKLLELEIDYYPIEEYITSRTPILHECLVGHQWRVNPNHILKGRGCPICNSTLKTHETYLKDLDKTIDILKEIYFKNGQDAADYEREIFKIYAQQRVNVPGFLKSEGNTELFAHPIDL